MFNIKRLQYYLRGFLKCSIISCLAIFLFTLFASPTFADKNLRPFQDDAGLFDPAKGPVNIRFQLFKDAGRIEIRVLDIKGQIVANHYLVELRAGDHNFSWNGKNAEGELLPDGRYELFFQSIIYRWFRKLCIRRCKNSNYTVANACSPGFTAA